MASSTEDACRLDAAEALVILAGATAIVNISSGAGVTRSNPIQSETPSDCDALVGSPERDQNERQTATAAMATGSETSGSQRRGSSSTTADSDSTVVGSPEQNVRPVRWDIEARGAKWRRFEREAKSGS